MPGNPFEQIKSGHVILLMLISLLTPFLFAVEGELSLALAGVICYLLAASVLLLLARKNLADFQAIMGNTPSSSEVIKYGALGIPMVALSILTIYLFFYPLSYIAPEFVTSWLLEFPATFSRGEGMYILAMIILAPVVEEFVFRGFLLNNLTARFGTTTAIALSSCLFAILHTDILGSFLFAVLLSLVYIKTRSLYGPILIHMANNMIAVSWEYLAYTENEHYTLELFREEWWTVVIALLIIAPCCYWMRNSPLSGSYC